MVFNRNGIEDDLVIVAEIPLFTLCKDPFVYDVLVSNYALKEYQKHWHFTPFLLQHKVYRDL